MKEQVGRRVHCIAPTVGWASTRNSDGAVFLDPLESRAFGRWGRQRLHVGLCGHAVHFACWDTYYASLLGRASANQVCAFRFALIFVEKNCRCFKNVYIVYWLFVAAMISLVATAMTNRFSICCGVMSDGWLKRRAVNLIVARVLFYFVFLSLQR